MIASEVGQSPVPSTSVAATGALRSRLRIVADDLTGALDAAAEFVPLVGPIAVAWTREAIAPADPGIAYDTASREVATGTAVREASRAAEAVALADAEIAFLKVDSLLRGHAGHELAAIFASGGFDAVVIAPAFPFQNRRTIGGQQEILAKGVWRGTGEDIVGTLENLGLAVHQAAPGTPVSGGISLYDASTDADLAAIVAAGRSFGGRVLWCGSGGLATALAAGAEPLPPPPIEGPLLGLFGTDHPVTLGQIDATGENSLRLGLDRKAALADIAARLAAGRSVIALPILPVLSRAEAREVIADYLGELVEGLVAPRSFVCGGGETLRGVCGYLGVEGLEVIGRLMPGVPVSRMRGGRWHGTLTISKSGAFGKRDFLENLIAEAEARTASTSLS
jgi:uncharacterized protein YgbK (DUF1537 family)